MLTFILGRWILRAMLSTAAAFGRNDEVDIDSNNKDGNLNDMTETEEEEEEEGLSREEIITLEKLGFQISPEHTSSESPDNSANGRSKDEQSASRGRKQDSKKKESGTGERKRGGKNLITKGESRKGRFHLLPFLPQASNRKQQKQTNIYLEAEIMKLTKEVEEAKGKRYTLERDQESSSKTMSQLRSQIDTLSNDNNGLQLRISSDQRVSEFQLRDERRRAGEELERVRNAMVEMLESERAIMRDQIARTSAGVRAMIDGAGIGLNSDIRYNGSTSDFVDDSYDDEYNEETPHLANGSDMPKGESLE